MKHYRIRIDVDIEARSRVQAETRAGRLYSDLGQPPWIVEVLPNGIEERIPIETRAKPSKAESRFTSHPEPQKGG